MKERRNLPRWELRNALLFKELEKETDFFKGFLQDINLVGVKVNLTMSFDVHTEIKLVIEIPGQAEPIFAEGEVIWQNAQGAEFPTGIRFTRFKPSDKERLLNHLSSKIQKTWWQQ